MLTSTFYFQPINCAHDQVLAVGSGTFPRTLNIFSVESPPFPASPSTSHQLSTLDLNSTYTYTNYNYLHNASSTWWCPSHSSSSCPSHSSNAAPTSRIHRLRSCPHRAAATPSPHCYRRKCPRTAGLRSLRPGTSPQEPTSVQHG
jgi:hypothetical protein